MSKKYELNKEEQAVEKQFESLKSVKNKKPLVDDLTEAAKQHVQNKKPITIRK